MASEVLQKIYTPIRDFLLKFLNREFMIFLFFLAISAGFWLIMTLNETYEREIKVPLHLTGVPNNVVITDSLPDSVRVVVRDKGYVLLPYYYSDAIQPVNLLFSSYAKSVGKGSVSVVELQKLIRSMLYSSTTIVSVKADKLDFTYNFGISKRVPIIFDGQAKTEDNYYLSHLVCKPESATIFASQHVLDSIKEVYTDYYVTETFNDTLETYLSLRKINGVKIVPSKVKVSFYADILTEKIVEVPITAVNMPAGMLLRTFPGHASVKVVVGKGNLSNVKPENFRATVDYREVADHPSDKCTVILSLIPKDVVKATLENNSVDYLIEKHE